MTPTPVSRWAVSFADLALLLLGFFVLLYAGRADVRDVAERARTALDSEAAVAAVVFDWAGTSLFASGEERLTDFERAALMKIGEGAARKMRRAPVRTPVTTEHH